MLSGLLLTRGGGVRAPICFAFPSPLPVGSSTSSAAGCSTAGSSTWHEVLEHTRSTGSSTSSAAGYSSAASAAGSVAGFSTAGSVAGSSTAAGSSSAWPSDSD